MYLLKVENGIVFPDNDQFTENGILLKKSGRFTRDHSYGEVAEVFVLDYLKKHYKKFNWYSCKEYCNKITKQDYNNKLDTLYGDIIGCFKKTDWAAVKINVKRSKEEGQIATATHYGAETDLFNSDLRGFTFYLSTDVDVQDISKWEMIWANCLVKERPMRIDNKYVWSREQLNKYAVPFEKIMKIVCKRKDKEAEMVHDMKLWDELNSLYRVLNADKLCYNTIIGEVEESNEIEVPSFEETQLDKNRPVQHHIYSTCEGKFATLGEKRLQEAEQISENGKDSVFYLYKMENGVTSIEKPLEIWYSDIKDTLEELYTTKGSNRFIIADKLVEYAR